MKGNLVLVYADFGLIEMTELLENLLIACVLNYLVGLGTENLITSIYQLIFIVYASIEGSYETSLLHSLVKALAGRLFDKN